MILLDDTSYINVRSASCSYVSIDRVSAYVIKNYLGLLTVY